MPLLNVTVKNFKQTNITPSSTTAFTGDQSNDVNSNTLAKACLITLTPSSSSENPISGAEGYWSFGTNDLSISSNSGSSQGKWLAYGNPYYPSTQGGEDAYWTVSGNPLINTEFDPGGGGDAVTNFNSSSPTLSMVNGVWVTINQSYNYLIGHDFWKYALQGTYLGENYEPTSGQAPTYYKVWTRNQNLANWNTDIIDKVVAVNSMPLNTDGTAQQGNKIYVVVVLRNNVTGQNIIDLGNTISIDLDGQPTFIDFDQASGQNEEWAIPSENIPIEIGDNFEGSWHENTNNGDGDVIAPDGVDADDIGGTSGVADEVVEVSFSDSDEANQDGNWGNVGLTDAQYEGDEVNNTSDYDSLASSALGVFDTDNDPIID